MSTSKKTKKDFMKEDLLNDPYNNPTLADIAAEEDSQEYVDAIKETKEQKKKAVYSFDKLKAKLERSK